MATEELGVQIFVEGWQKFNSMMGGAEKKVSGFAGAAGKIGANMQTVGKLTLGAMGAAAGAVGTFAAGLGAVIYKSTMSAARISEMRAVLNMLGERAGWSATQIQENIDAMTGLGIRTDVAQEVLAQFARQQLDVADATMAARVAQDLAVLSGRDSSETLSELIYMIQTQNSSLTVARDLGIRAGDAMDSYAESIGKTTEELTQAERQQAMLNAVQEAGVQVAGAYDTAMQEPGKALRSLSRHFYEASIAIGQAFLPAMSNIVKIIGESIKGFRGLLEEGQPLQRIFESMGKIVDTLINAFFGAIPSGEGFVAILEKVADVLEDASGYIWLFFNRIQRGKGILDSLHTILQTVGMESLSTFIDRVLEGVSSIWEFIEPIAAWIQENIKLQDILIALGIAIATIVLPVLYGIVAAAAPIIATFVAVVAVVALLRKAWENNFLGIQDKTQAVMGWIQENVPTIIENVREFITNAIATIRAWWAENGDAILAKASEVWTTILAVISATIGTLKKLISTVLEAIRVWWAAHGDSVKTIVQAFIEFIANFIQSRIDMVRSVIQTALTIIQAFWSTHGDAVKAVVSNLWEMVKTLFSIGTQYISNLIDIFAAAISGDWETFGAKIKENTILVWEAIKTVISTAAQNLITILKSAVKGMVNAFEAIDWASIGRGVIQGIKNGIMSGIGALKDAVVNAASAAINAARGALGEKSPSKVFHIIGQDAMAGMILGVEDMIPQVQATMTAAVSPPRTSAVSPTAMPGVQNQVSNQTVNNYNLTTQTTMQPGGLAMEFSTFSMATR